MGRVLSRALEAAGLADLEAKVLSGSPLTAAELEPLSQADLLLVAGLADSVRAYFRGDEVRVLGKREAREAGLVEFAEAPSPQGKTGAELLRELSLLRLRTAPSIGIAVSMETLGLELAQTALLFGADTLIGDLHSERTLPLLDDASARRREVAGLVERSGRHARFAEEPELAEQAP